MCDHKFTARRGKRIILVQMTALKPDASQGGPDLRSSAQKKARPEQARLLVSFGQSFAYASEPSISLQAATRPLTASTDLSNMAFSSLFMLISTTRSTPPAPITVGTPT